MKNKKNYNYNYVYRITNKVEQKHYYGVRSCNVEAKLDLGIKYFSSSRDKEFKDDQKNHPENYKYKIVRICSTRKEGDALEIKLHEKFNVGINESFYNKSTRTSMGFTFSGGKHTLETKLKMSEAKLGEKNPMFGKELSPEHKQKLSEAKQNMSDETRQKMSEAHTGVPKSDETRQKLSEAMKGKEHTDESRQKMSEAKLGVSQEQVQCPHCGKIGGKSLMARWHFDNCKYKEI
jgi:hypothetical protein